MVVPKRYKVCKKGKIRKITIFCRYQQIHVEGEWKRTKRLGGGRHRTETTSERRMERVVEGGRKRGRRKSEKEHEFNTITP